MKIIFYGDSLTEGRPGVSFFKNLQAQLEGHELINYGKGGDTVTSLYQRIIRDDLALPSDLAFLWIGTNDVLAKVSPSIKNYLNPPCARDHEEFADYYKMTLDALCPKSKKLIAVSPLFIGEDLSNEWNRELEELANIIRRLSKSHKNTEYLDLRRIFVKELASKKPSNYVLKSPVRLMVDLALDSPEKVNKKSAERGLCFTLDGIHLNGQGAEIVAHAFYSLVLPENRFAHSINF
ncbi:hypothetical protein AMJ44_13170 [candidate division WOR-1 bacterium DG_54_3]|uniref:SGNH hydrolase-type esterase domain-containing protein n=1 Tax=candidate division WOR-1 bacterium DG_54_3 TaxID=1703775 RepID=A0A0S7XP71_UNCSA|nr:MAG: hypothetical protein AMJ44_13170 [candidate division WOR-1 bacterium DG_54_3]